MFFLSSFKHALNVNFLCAVSIPVLVFGLMSLHLFSGHQLEDSREFNMLQAKGLAGKIPALLVGVRPGLTHVAQTVSSGTTLPHARVDDSLSRLRRAMV